MTVYACLPTIVPGRDQYASCSHLLFVLLLTICGSENALQSGGTHRYVQAAYPFYAARKSISSPLRPRSPTRLLPQGREKLDDHTKSPSFVFVLLLLLTMQHSCFTGLAEIFRPGLISHPTHELEPSEHRLSQEVLEFLIDHDDWFMLDAPPPPPATC